MTDPNPYEPSQSTSAETEFSPRAAMGMFMLALLAFPAGGVAFAVTCLGVISISQTPGGNGPDPMPANFETALLLGSIAGIAVIVGIFYLAIRIRLRKDR